jgi:hypothetical protein
MESLRITYDVRHEINEEIITTTSIAKLCNEYCEFKRTITDVEAPLLRSYPCRRCPSVLVLASLHVFSCGSRLLGTLVSEV